MDETNVTGSRTVAEAEYELEKQAKKSKRKKRIVTAVIVTGLLLICVESAGLFSMIKGKELTTAETPVIHSDDVRRINLDRLRFQSRGTIKMKGKNITIKK